MTAQSENFTRAAPPDAPTFMHIWLVHPHVRGTPDLLVMCGVYDIGEAAAAWVRDAYPPERCGAVAYTVYDTYGDRPAALEAPVAGSPRVYERHMHAVVYGVVEPWRYGRRGAYTTGAYTTGA